MKKKVILLGFSFLMFCMVFVGCDLIEESKTKYYYEFFTITIANFNSVPTPTTESFNAAKSYRNSLRNFAVELVGSGTDATRDDIYSLLTQSGLTPTETNNAISGLNSVGNLVGYFQHANNNNLLIIMYIEKI